MGRDFCRTLHLYSDQDTSYYQQMLAEVQHLMDLKAPEIEPA